MTGHPLHGRGGEFTPPPGAPRERVTHARLRRRRPTTVAQVAPAAGSAAGSSAREARLLRGATPGGGTSLADPSSPDRLQHFQTRSLGGEVARVEFSFRVGMWVNSKEKEGVGVSQQRTAMRRYCRRKGCEQSLGHVKLKIGIIKVFPIS